MGVGCTHHVTTPRQLGETLKAHFVVSPFGMWQKEDKMKKESTQIMDCSTFFSLFLNIFSVVVEHIFVFSPLFGEDSLQPESHELFHFFFRCFSISYECLWSG